MESKIKNKEILADALRFAGNLDKDLINARLEIAKIDLDASKKSLDISQKEYNEKLKIAQHHDMDFDTIDESVKAIITILTEIGENSEGIYPFYFNRKKYS